MFFSNVKKEEKWHISKSYVNLALINDPDDKEKLLKNVNEAIINERIQNQKSLYAAKTPVELEKLFDDPKHKRQLIIGPPGSGKTTLCQHIFYHCTKKNKLWSNKFNAVFWISLRKLKGNDANIPADNALLLAYIIKHYTLCDEPVDKIDDNELKQFTIDNAKGILWLLDGFDEVVSEARTKGSTIQRFLAKLNNYSSALIITSRPQPQYFISDENLGFDRVLENIGFTDENITEYVHKFLENEADSKECLKSLQQNPAVWGSAHIPLILELICSIWQNPDKEELSGITSLPNLYTVMANNLWKRYWDKIKPGHRYRPKEILKIKEVANLAKDIANLAAKGFEKSEIILSSETLEEIHKQGAHCNTSFDDWCDLLDKSGFVRTVISNNIQETQYYFIHLSFQEYFAGVYQAQGFINDNIRAKELFGQHKYNPVYCLMWQFMVGGLYQDYKTNKNTYTETNKQPPLVAYWDIALNSIDINGTSQLRLIIDSLESCGVDRSLEIHNKLFKQIQSILFIIRYNKLLLNSPQLLKECLSNLSSEISLDEIKHLNSLLSYRRENLNLNISPNSNIIMKLCALLDHEDQWLRKYASDLLSKITPKKHYEKLITGKNIPYGYPVHRAPCARGYSNEVFREIAPYKNDEKKYITKAFSILQYWDWNPEVRSMVCRLLRDILKPIWRQYLQQLKKYANIILDEELINIIVCVKAIDIYFADEKVTYKENDSEYKEWIKIINNYIKKDEIFLVIPKNNLAEFNLSDSSCIIS